MTMKISAAFPSKYLKAADLQDRNVTVVMDTVQLEDVGDNERKPVVRFQGKSKGLVLNKVNARTIAAGYGDDTAGWRGRPLTLFPAMVDFRGDTVEAIRVRVPPAKPAADVQTPPAPPPRPRPEHDNGRTVMRESENPRNDMDDEIPF
jgi:hypothetical protein